MANANRKKFGLHLGPIKCTRVMVTPPNDHFAAQTPPVDARSMLCINDNTGVVTSVNQYDGNFGKGASPEGMTQAIPAEGSEKWKAWKKKGYEMLDSKAAAAFAEKWGTIELVKTEAKAGTTPKAETAKA